MSNLTNTKILELLDSIDDGYQPTEEELRQLKKVEILNLTGYSITILPEAIGQLTSLIELDVSYTSITTLPKTIRQLKSLQKLYFGSVDATDIPKDVFHLQSLQMLYISHSNIVQLPEEIGQLSSLEIIQASSTEITALPKAIGKLPSLRILEVSDTGITEIPEEIKQLKSLQSLHIGGTKITELPEWIGDLPNLECLDLSGLTLKKIPKSLAMCGLKFISKRNGKSGINLYRVTLTEQGSISVFLESPNLIPDLYKDQVPIRECKVIFLGDGGVGKSYTILRILNGGKKETKEEPYITEETHGVSIGDYRVERENDFFNIHFWDFGGQEILHSMHRCFLTEETCYVVMLRTRENESTSRVRYWLRVVQTSAPQSRVLLFVNCWGNASGDRIIDASLLKKEFPQIWRIIYCSAKESSTEEFIQKLIIPLHEMVATSDMCRKTINQKWCRLINAIRGLQKQAIENRKYNFLTKTDYIKLCANIDIDDENIIDLLTLLNNLGVCFSYHLDKVNQKVLPEYKLLNPVWLTNALYAIVEEGAVHAQDGIIQVDSIRTMLHNTAQDWLPKVKYRRTAPEITYDDEECKYILDVAETHNLCYRLNAEEVFFPTLCGNSTPMDVLNKMNSRGQSVSYLLRYSYLPENVLHQLMIHCMRSDMYVKPRWLRGMVLSVWNLYTAYVRMIDDDNLCIDIYSTGEQRAYALFWMLRKEIVEINQRLNLNADEFILDGKTEFLLEDVVAAAQDNANIYGRGKKYNARKLLGEFYEESIIQSMQIENDTIIIPISHREYHHCSKNNTAFRNALYDAYNRICPYCGQTIQNIRDMEVDHILASNYIDRPELHSYLTYLASCGFCIDQPDYIENYFPTHSYCNLDKSNRVNEFSLPYWHDIALQHTPKVMRLMEKYKITNLN